MYVYSKNWGGHENWSDLRPNQYIKKLKGKLMIQLSQVELGLCHVIYLYMYEVLHDAIYLIFQI